MLDDFLPDFWEQLVKILQDDKQVICTYVSHPLFCQFFSFQFCVDLKLCKKSAVFAAPLLGSRSSSADDGGNQNYLTDDSDDDDVVEDSVEGSVAMKKRQMSQKVSKQVVNFLLQQQ